MKKDPASSGLAPLPGGQFLVYRTEDGKLKIDVRFEGDTVWLTQQHMAALFQTTKQNVSLHIRNIFSERELHADSVVKESLTTAADGKNYATKFFNLDVIISVGYRVKSLQGRFGVRQVQDHHFDRRASGGQRFRARHEAIAEIAEAEEAQTPAAMNEAETRAEGNEVRISLFKIPSQQGISGNSRIARCGHSLSALASSAISSVAGARRSILSS